MPRISKERDYEELREIASLTDKKNLSDPLQKLVDEQAEDEGLWCEAANIVEAYLQQELRRLHAAIENRPAVSGQGPKSRDERAADALWSDPIFLRRYADLIEFGPQPDNVINSREELDALFENVLAPSGPLSDEPRENENQDGAAPVLGGEE
jgi:hypothetical protein